MSLFKDKDGTINIRLVILLIVIFTGVVAAIFYFPPVPTRTAEALTNGSINFTDKMGNAIQGTIEVSIANATKETRENVNSVNWNGIPNARISFNALETAHVSLNFRISGDSPDSNVTIENYGMYLPDNAIRTFPPGSPIKYVEISQQGVSFSEAVITIKYRAIELRGHDETSLTIYRHDGTNWVELPSVIDTTSNTISATVNELSVFAVAAKPSRNIEVIDTGKAPVLSEISTYDEKRQLIKRARTDSISSDDVPGSGDIEVDALETKNVAVRLKLKASGGGKVILDNHGRNNPVFVAAPGNAIKYVDISALGFSFDSAEVKIHYTDEELGSTDENALVIYHWNGAAWEPLTTAVDAVNNVLTATTMSLSPFAASGGTGGTDRVLVATNRYVILDDPNSTSARNVSGSGFMLPLPNDWNNRGTVWTGKNTIINATALYIDKNGTAVNNTIIKFTLYDPNGTANYTINATTDKYGLANFSYDLNNKNFYGRWRVRAENGSTGANYSFIYNWWGCSWGSGTCGGQHKSVTPTTGAAANSPYLDGRDRTTGAQPDHRSHGTGWTNSDTNACTHCHQSFDDNPGGAYTAVFKNYTKDVHRNISCTNAGCHGDYNTHGTTTTSGNMLIASCYNASGGCHTPANRSDISNKSTLNSSNVATALSLYSINSTAFNATFHTPNATVPCIICHGPMHNITKPDEFQRFIRNTNTEDSQCKTCHVSYTEHNSSNLTSGGVNCTLCHSDDVHEIKVFSQNATYITLNINNPNASRGNCTNCHQNSTFFGILKNLATAGNYTGRNPPQIQTPVNHSNDPFSGKKWNQTPGYWTNTSQITWCKYCHGETNHKSSALGRPSLFNGSNSVNSTISSSSWCQQCHWQGASNYSSMVSNFTEDGLKVPPEISGNATYKPGSTASDGTNYYNHTLGSYSDDTCRGCHSSLSGTAGVTLFMHNVAEGGGGPDCISCHDYGKTGAQHRINNSAMNSSPAIHKNLNSNASNSSNVSAENKKCWGCHTSNGTQPTDMGDRYLNPYKCYDCHNGSSKPYTNVSNALNVSEHFKNGTDIRAATSAIDNSTSCTICHNLSEMKVSYTEDDAFNSNYSFSSHYGRNRTFDQLIRNGTSTNCTYCHQNSTTAFNVAMINPSYNSSIGNHSLRYNSSNPGCTVPQCHNSGWLHNDTLTKPNLTLPNSTLCLNCHGSNGSGGTNYTGAVTGVKAKHNNSVACSECHLNTGRDIHPVKYLQANASYNTSNSTGVNCVICHQGTAVDNNLSKTPPKIPNPLHHSDNLSNGSIWGSYWTNNSPQTACIYCHNDTKHNATPLGRILQWQPNYSTYSPIGNNYTCSDCHYRNDSNYSQMNASFVSAGLPIPPEITNGTNWNGTSSGYFNHTLSDYADLNCKTCHGKLLNASANMSEFLHNVAIGMECKVCHFDYTFMNSSGKPERYVNSTMFNNSPHVNLRCEDCHTKGHNNIGARKACEDCHAYQGDPKNESDRHNITGDPLNYKISGISVVNITDCTICHDAGLYANATNTYGLPPKTRNCDYCHTYPDKTYS